jgi:hypothetical protein
MKSTIFEAGVGLVFCKRQTYTKIAVFEATPDLAISGLKCLYNPAWFTNGFVVPFIESVIILIFSYMLLKARRRKVSCLTTNPPYEIAFFKHQTRSRIKLTLGSALFIVYQFKLFAKKLLRFLANMIRRRRLPIPFSCCHARKNEVYLKRETQTLRAGC